MSNQVWVEGHIAYFKHLVFDLTKPGEISLLRAEIEKQPDYGGTALATEILLDIMEELVSEQDTMNTWLPREATKVQGLHRSVDKGFLPAVNLMADYIHQWAVRKGFWEEGEDRNKAEQIALMHSELSEALEGLRSGNQPSDHIPDFSLAEEEFADVVIRILDTCAAYDFRISEAIVAKMMFNEGRPYKHGKEF